MGFLATAVALIFLPVLTLGRDSPLIPIQYAPRDSHEARGLHDVAHVLTPRSNVLSHYLHEDLGFNYVVEVAHSHDSLRYVSLDDFDGLHGKLGCKYDGSAKHASTVTLSFGQEKDLSTVRDLWQDGSDLVFLTSHPKCDAFGDRSFLKAKHIEYSIEDRTANIICSHGTPLARSNSLSKGVSVSGNPAPHRHHKYTRREDYSFNDTFNFNETFDQPRAPFMTSDGFNLTCIDCSLTGQILPSFYIKIDDNLFDLGEETLNNNFTVNDVVQEATLSAVISEDIAMNMTLEFDTIDELHAQCNIPPTNCSLNVQTPGDSVASIGRSLFGALSKPRSFTIGEFSFQIGASFGLNFILDVEAELTLTVPFSGNISQGQTLSYAFNNDTGVNTFKPNFNIRPPTVSAGALDACVTFEFGPRASLSLTNTQSNKTIFSLGGEVDMPKFDVCASEVHHVDASCNPNGPFDTAVELAANVSAGVELEGDLFSISGDTGSTLEPNLFGIKRCFKVTGTGNSTANGAPGSGITHSPNGTLQTTDSTSAKNSLGARVGPSIGYLVLALGVGSLFFVGL